MWKIKTNMGKFKVLYLGSIIKAPIAINNNIIEIANEGTILGLKNNIEVMY